MNKAERFCLWDGVGDGYYKTECGNLVHDPGRSFAVCFGCENIVVTFSELQNLIKRFESMPGPVQKLLAFHDLANEAANFAAEIADRAETLLKADFQGKLGIDEQTALSEVRSAAEVLEAILRGAKYKIKTGPTISHLFEKGGTK